MLSKLHPAHLARYKDLARLFLRYGRDDFVRVPGAGEVVGGNIDEERRRKAEELTRDIEAMGATFIKVGQLLSTRADLLPPEYLSALERLQDDVRPFPFEEVERTVQDDLGVRLSKGFARFDEHPLACASLGQVHRATMRDGREVVVKVQRPGIRAEISRDLESLAALAEFADRHTELGRRYEFGRVVEEMRKRIIRELDYIREAGNLHVFRRALAEFPNLVVPEPVDDYCSHRVVTMDYIAGHPVTSFSGVVFTEVKGRQLAGELFRAYLHQILAEGFFHADPHPGNVLLTEGSHRLALIDLGMTGHVPEAMREHLARFLIEVSEANSSGAAEIAMRMGSVRDGFEREKFVSSVSEIVQSYRSQRVGEMEIGGLVMEVSRACADSGLRIHDSVLMLGKTLLNLDRVGKTLDPQFDPNAAIREYAGAILRKQLSHQFSLSALIGTMQDTRELVAGMPAKLNRFLDLVSDNAVRVHVDAIDEKSLIDGFQKIANRITVGLVLGSIIVGAAMMMSVETSFTLFGYPGLAIIFFFLAAFGGLVLAWNVLMQDR